MSKLNTFNFNLVFNRIFFLFSVEVDFHLGTKVFGFRDLRNGKFVPKSNYSLKIDAFCDGVR